MMTRSEYELRMEVYQLQELDAEEKIAKIAFYNQLAQSTTGGKNPRAKYDKFDFLFVSDITYKITFPFHAAAVAVSLLYNFKY